MKAWFFRRVAAKPPPLAGVPGVVAPAAAPTGLDAAPLRADQADTDHAFFAWLLGGPLHESAALGERERAALQRLDRLLTGAAEGASLLPRAAAVVPQLLARLRSDAVSLPELAQQVSRDMTLVAEVIRMANGALYRREEAVVALDDAIRVLGVDGMRSAIARAVLKPLVDAPGGKRVEAGAKRLWVHTDHKAQLCAALARSLRLDPFEGYLLGLVHNAVGSAVLRSLDGIDAESPWTVGPPFAAELARRRDSLFGLIAGQWQLSERLTEVAADVARRGLAEDAPAPVRLLYAGHRLATLLCNADRPGAAARAEGLLASAGPGVRECYVTLAALRGAASP